MLPIRHEAGFLGRPAAVYCDRLVHEQRADRPYVVMLHGGNHTGSCWLTTVDGRPGWAYQFAQRGYPVCVPDWPGHGRSGSPPGEAMTGEALCEALASLVRDLGGSVVLIGHSMGGALMWRVAELCIDQVVAMVGVAPGPPGNLQPVAEIIDRDGDRMLVKSSFRTMWLDPTRPAVADRSFVVDKLIASSTRFPPHRIDDYIRSLTPTASRLVYERLNIDGSQVRIADPAVFARKRCVIVTGGEDPDHSRDTDGAIAVWLAESGADVEFIWLPDRGVVGNGHMLMMEDNSEEIAELVVDALERIGETRS